MAEHNLRHGCLLRVNEAFPDEEEQLGALESTGIVRVQSPVPDDDNESGTMPELLEEITFKTVCGFKRNPEALSSTTPAPHSEPTDAIPALVVYPCAERIEEIGRRLFARRSSLSASRPIGYILRDVWRTSWCAGSLSSYEASLRCKAFCHNDTKD